MNKNLTDINLLVDRSGSMASILKDTNGGIASLIDDQKKQPGDANISLVTFDTEYEVEYIAKAIADAPEFILKPRWSTALYDSLHKYIVDIGDRLSKMSEDDRPEKVIVAVFTDGQENASKEITAKALSEKIKHQRDNYQWIFLFIGANQDAILAAGNIGILAKDSITYAANSHGTQAAYASTSAAFSMLRCSKNLHEATSAMSFTQADRDEQSKAGA